MAWLLKDARIPLQLIADIRLQREARLNEGSQRLVTGNEPGSLNGWMDRHLSVCVAQMTSCNLRFHTYHHMQRRWWQR